MSDEDFEPRPNDYLVEPMFAHLEPDPEREEAEVEERPAARGLWGALLRLLGRG